MASSPAVSPSVPPSSSNTPPLDTPQLPFFSSNAALYILVVPSCGTLSSALTPFQGCSDSLEVDKGREVHGVVFKLGFDRDVFVGNTLLMLYGELGLFKLGMEVHGFSLRMGIESDIFTANSLIDMYAKSGSSCKASTVFNTMRDRNIVSWNAMVANYAQNRLESAAVELVRQMQTHGETPNN
ncbi:Tetratricopeptide-like helical domain superfamily, partial [Sesbania bispinosa]